MLIVSEIFHARTLEFRWCINLFDGALQFSSRPAPIRATLVQYTASTRLEYKHECHESKLLHLRIVILHLSHAKLLVCLLR